MAYKPVDSTLNFCAREHEVLEFWQQKKIFEKTVEKGKDKPVFTFYDGPPTANGKPHIGHIITRVIKDIIPRYKIMKGYGVLRKAGWDTHGLPVELEVEKQLKLDGKQDIERYGVAPFIEKCKHSVWTYKAEWEKMTSRVGYWVDMDEPYVTYHDSYIESVWWSLKQLWEKGLIYKGHKIVPYCPRCGTALSSHEVAQGYKDVTDTTITVKFPAADQPDTYYLAWTTTPWTLPSNVALCMNPDEDYVKVEHGGERYILAKALADKHFEDGYKVLETKKGREYERSPYLPLFDYEKPDKKAHYITCDSFVTLSDGTGIVHIAPAFGEDDSKVGRAYGLPFVQLVDDRGNFKPGTGKLEGKFAKDADALIIEDLSSRSLVLCKAEFEHSYPFCWRCDTPLLYYARKSWFISMTNVKDELVKNNAQVNWIPPAIGSGRMGNFLENVIDWGFSRERYWGTPLPAWVCDECGDTHFIGSKQELKEKCGDTPGAELLDTAPPEDGLLHRPYIDTFTFPCKCGGTHRRTPEVIDCWYDSGAMPFAQHHYPFENKELFEKNFPADFISEAVDQTRGWFYTLLAISTALFGKPAFKNCIVLGHVNDKNGQKMSKHKGNVVDPWTVLDKQGADALRWYFYTSSNPWLPSRFYAEAVDEAQRKFMGTLWNTYAFFVLYAGIDKYNPNDYDIKTCKLTLMDRWALSGLNRLVEHVDGALSRYDITDAARKIQDYTEDLSNWYVRRCRERYWVKDMTEDKAAAFTTLYHVLTELSKLIAPFVPFLAESIYQNLVAGNIAGAPESVHLCDFPVPVAELSDPNVLGYMADVMDLVVLARSCRNAAGIKNRQPLAAMYVHSQREIKLPEEYLAIVADELNIKSYRTADKAEKFITYEIKPQLKTLGPKYGALIGAIRTHLQGADGTAVAAAVRGGGTYRAQINGTEAEFTAEDLLISAVSLPGYAAASDRGITVALDTTLTEELLLEGASRELISKIQTMRKDAGFEVTDRITVLYEAEGRALSVLENSPQLVLPTVLADSAAKGRGGEAVREWDINGDKAVISVSRVKK